MVCRRNGWKGPPSVDTKTSKKAIPEPPGSSAPDAPALTGTILDTLARVLDEAGLEAILIGNAAAALQAARERLARISPSRLMAMAGAATLSPYLTT